MSKKLRSASAKGKITPRHVVTALGIFLLTFGVFAWQWSVFNERNSDRIAETPPLLEPPPGTHWHEANSQMRLAIAARIRGQLSALRRKNYGDALQYHTAAVRQAFLDASDFQRSIESDYPQFPGNKKVVFRFVNMDSKHQFANAGISVTAPDGTLFNTVYQLSFEDGRWGVRGIARPHLAEKSQV